MNKASPDNASFPALNRIHQHGSSAIRAMQRLKADKRRSLGAFLPPPVYKRISRYDSPLRLLPGRRFLILIGLLPPPGSSFDDDER